MKRNIYLIVGEGRCGKSSLVRALTGVFRRSKKAVEVELSNPKNAKIKIAVWPQSAQEARKKPKDILDDINDLPDNISNVLLVLRFRPHIINYYATDYIDLLIEQHDIVEVMTMSSNKSVPELSNFKNPLKIESSLTHAVNANAAKVRKEWKWL